MRMIKLMISAAALVAVTLTAAQARQRTHYDAGGRVIGRSATDSQGTTTFYDAGGRVSARSSTSGSTTTTYDPRGRIIERSYRNKPN
ncbi:hypothetical protein [Bradyrhizobium elkanii]|uniref:hypothetical protein n=1 Tax=Bradyrhizobium elkanii TaxID=29448 RepID=UPI000427C22B|nr:hypothetical protein [Bradyrhizobium elkanii]